MINILLTRCIHWKKQWPSLIFWLFFPIVATLFIISISNTIQEDSRVPIALVLEEKTERSMELFASIKASPLVRVYELSETEALHQLEKHELDSVFIIHQGYEDKITKGIRDRLLTSYQSDLSFAYAPVKEMVISYVQQDAGRAKAANVVAKLSEQYDPDTNWTFEEIIAKSKEVQKEESLLTTTYSIANHSTQSDDSQLVIWNVWGLWAVLTLLSTLLLFDWVIKERMASIQPRFAFMQVSLATYLIGNLLIHLLLLLLIDLVAVVTFRIFLDESFELAYLSVIFSYHMMVTLGAFLLALCFRNTFIFYSCSFAITLLLAVTSGAILPIEGITSRYDWFQFINPLQPLLSGEVTTIGLIILITITAFWYLRKEQINA